MAEGRKRKQKKGLIRKDVWIKPENSEKLKKYVAKYLQ